MIWPFGRIQFRKKVSEKGWDDWFPSRRPSATGISVTSLNAATISAVYACIRVLADTIASLPLMIYERKSHDEKQLAENHPLYPILHNKPNRWQTSYEFRQMLMGHLLLRGNAYVQKAINSGGKVVSLLPLHPDYMTVSVNKDGSILYEYQPPKLAKKEYTEDQIWHLREMSDDGIMGIAPGQQCSEALALAMAAEKYGAAFFGNSAIPDGVLKHPQRLSDKAKQNLRESIADIHGGSRNAWKTMILEEGMDWLKMGIDNESGQFLQIRQFQVEEVARIYKVPVILIGHPNTTMTYASAEQLFLSFAIHTMRPHCIGWEQSINMHLLGNDPDYFAEFNLDALVRGDLKTRYASYAIALQNKWLNVNEVRAMDNRNPREGGEVYENPNITPGGKAGWGGDNNQGGDNAGT